ncbi:cation transporter [Paeniglutamicibacter sp. NPDC091659]|uniref:cation transporter n=1 Tax=Paeniglutamicibacter sp. NPDC091659 TaxID=3364389 RepID=UPI00381D06FC
MSAGVNAAFMNAERRALLYSLWISVAVASGALLLGIVTSTRIIVFDGAYMGIGIILSWLSLRAAIVSTTGPTNRFPFGRDALTPLVVLIQGLAIAGTLLFAAGDAIVIIRDGGSPVNPIVIATYGTTTAAVGFFVARWISRKSPGSDLVLAEVSQWRAGSVLSVMMVAGAVAAVILQNVGLDLVARYIDPVLVLAACVIVAAVPIRLVKTGANELLEGAPSLELSAAVAEAVGSVEKAFVLPPPVIRSGKVGRKLYVEVDFIVPGSDWNIGEEDAVRRAVNSALEPLGLDIWAVVSLTADPDLA